MTIPSRHLTEIRKSILETKEKEKIRFYFVQQETSVLLARVDGKER